MKCYVIMPYGKTEAEHKSYLRTYKLLIKSAVEECGLTCTRSDIDEKGGYIMSNVIEDLATADIVVADLSGLNWNVAYELGIRHVLQKSGTVILCDDETVLPFDIQSLNVFVYPKNWLDDMEELNEKLKKVILGRLNSNKGDSPIHEKYPFLPEEVISGLSSATDDSLIAAKEKIAELESELAGVYAKIEGMGLSLEGASIATTVDYGKQFIADYNNSIYNSDAAVAHLRELLSKGDKEGFLTFLGKVLEVGYLDEVDCRNIYILVKKLNTPGINRTYLEAVTKFYPENEDLFGYLANEYSKNYHTGEKAIQMVNGIVGVIKKEGVYQLSKTVRVTAGKLGSLCDVYLHLKKYADLLEICKLIYARYQDNAKVSSLAMRNMLLTAPRIECWDEAGEYARKLVEIAPNDDMTYYAVYRYHALLEHKEESLLALEKCIELDPRDIDYYYMMAGFIVDEQYARDPITKEPISIVTHNADEYAVPFILSALAVSPDSIQRAADFLRRNNFTAYLDQVIDTYQRGRGDYAGAFPELNFAAVEYCIHGH